MSTFLFKLGHFASRHPWRIIGAWLVLACATFFLNTQVGGEPNEDFRLPGADSQRAVDLLQDEFPAQNPYTSEIVFSDEGLVGRAETRASVASALDAVAGLPHVVAVSDPYDAASPMISPDGHMGFSTVTFDTGDVKLMPLDGAEDAVAPLRDAGLTVEYSGLLGYADAPAEPKSELIGMGVAVVVLVLAFGSLVAMSLPLGVALISLLVGTGAIGLASGQLPIPASATLVGSMLGLGVGIDYALFVLARHRENIGTDVGVHESVGRANATAGLSVLFAGSTVVLAIAGLQLAGVPMIAAMGWTSALMVAVTMLAALTLLPALLGLAGKRIDSLRVVRSRSRDRSRRTWSGRWANHVADHPVRYLVAAVALLGVVAAPASALRIGFPDDGNVGTESTLRRSYDMVAEGFGPGFNGPLQVVVDVEGAADPDGYAATVASALQATPGVSSVTAPAVSPDGDVVVLTVLPDSSPQSSETADLVGTLRTDVLPPITDAYGGAVMVTGNSALQVDLSSKLQSRMPLFIAAVLLLSLMVLVPVFRSVWVPVKAAALNLVSIGAAYGVLVAVFQWGWGAEWLGIHETMPINPLAPMLMFAILFGLSMDYEVFLLGRVREEYRLSGDPRASLIAGVTSTAPVITSAALIMISVFYAFVLSPDITSKLFGLGLGTAVLLDVTLVRMVLVPAAMSLLGHRAWHLPAWLDRLLPDIDLDGHRDSGQHPGVVVGASTTKAGAR
jgi:RND superfamily putative drug exporter